MDIFSVIKIYHIKDLLYNGQIIQKGKQCPSQYKKNCERIDTLEQELCVNEKDKCPLYDLGLGNKSDTSNYINDKKSGVYYNNDNYNEKNKKIIGRIILNEGQPCYNTLEKLWTKFYGDEADETHLKCDLKIFDKYDDDRYEKRGSITYKKIYEDNLDSENRNKVLKNIKGDERVFLYKREFLGIKKECDEKFNLNKETYEIFSNSQNYDSIILIIGGSLVAGLALVLFIFNVLDTCCSGSDVEICINVGFYITCMAIFIGGLIGQFVLWYRIRKNDLSDYNCGDDITNELIKIGSKDNLLKKLYIEINLFLDVFHLGGNLLAIIIALILEGIDKHKESKNELLLYGDYNEESDEHKDLNAINPCHEDVPLNIFYPNQY